MGRNHQRLGSKRMRLRRRMSRVRRGLDGIDRGIGLIPVQVRGHVRRLGIEIAALLILGLGCHGRRRAGLRRMVDGRIRPLELGSGGHDFGGGGGSIGRRRRMRVVRRLLGVRGLGKTVRQMRVGRAGMFERTGKRKL